MKILWKPIEDRCNFKQNTPQLAAGCFVWQMAFRRSGKQPELRKKPRRQRRGIDPKEIELAAGLFKAIDAT
jgi:hypothetical protein